VQPKRQDVLASEITRTGLNPLLHASSDAANEAEMSSFGGIVFGVCSLVLDFIDFLLPMKDFMDKEDSHESDGGTLGSSSRQVKNFISLIAGFIIWFYILISELIYLFSFYSVNEYVQYLFTAVAMATVPGWCMCIQRRTQCPRC
jgi:hypothetical protein